MEFRDENLQYFDLQAKISHITLSPVYCELKLYKKGMYYFNILPQNNV